MTIVIHLADHQYLAIIGAFLMGAGLAWIIAADHFTTRTNRQWFAERERVHQERKRAGEFIKH